MSGAGGLLRAGVLLLPVCALAGCAARNVRQPVTALKPNGMSYIDLAPGWRLRVVTPILKSGGYVLQPSSETREGHTVTLSVGKEFQGYEVAYYTVKRRNGLALASAEVTRDGTTSPQREPVAHLFELPRGVRYLRLIYLVRVSHADHDMAIAAARNMDDLAALTQRVESDPAHACRAEQEPFCAWIPKGIAVVPEVPKKIEGGVEWVPAR